MVYFKFLITASAYDCTAYHFGDSMVELACFLPSLLVSLLSLNIRSGCFSTGCFRASMQLFLGGVFLVGSAQASISNFNYKKLWKYISD